MMYGVWNPPAVAIDPAEVLRLFRRGSDTIQIARRLGVDEARIASILAKARDAERLEQGKSL